MPTTAYSAAYNQTGTFAGQPLGAATPARQMIGTSVWGGIDVTIPTTNLNEVDDLYLLFPLPCKSVLDLGFLRSADLDSNGSPTLNADIVVRYYPTADAAASFDILYDSSAETAFTAAINPARTFLPRTASGGKYVAPNDYRGHVDVCFKVVAAAATAAAGAVNVTLVGR